MSVPCVCVSLSFIIRNCSLVYNVCCIVFCFPKAPRQCKTCTYKVNRTTTTKCRLEHHTPNRCGQSIFICARIEKFHHFSLSYYSFYISFVSPLPELYEPFVDDNLTPCALLYNTFFNDDRNVLKNETKHKNTKTKKNSSWFFLCFVSLPAHFRYNLTNRSKFMRSKRATYGCVVSLIYIMDW